MMNRLMTAFMLSVYLISCGYAQSLDKVQDSDLAHLLSGLTIEAEQDLDDFRFRALSIRGNGECDGGLLHCPMVRLYVVVSTFDESPDVAVYSLPLSHGWTIRQVEEVKAYAEHQKYLVISLVRNVVVSDSSGVKIDDQKYKIKINPWEGTVLD